ncbi:hypothetical protein [Amycolatopsis sp. FDAARGOS 1241]|nr:hypothetical protein [Amycolatopsis sp. FDAARGOS 1241]
MNQAQWPVTIVRDRDGTVPTVGSVVVGVDDSPMRSACRPSG